MRSNPSVAALSTLLALTLVPGLGCDGEDCDDWKSAPQDQRIHLARGPLAIGTGGALFVQRPLATSPFMEFAEVPSDIDAELFGAFVPTSPGRSRWFVVGESGTIRGSEDHGETWQAPATEPVVEDLYAVRFACTRPRLGMIVGYSGALLRTLDGGTTWERMNSGTSLPLRDIAVLDEQVAVAVGDGGTLVRSIDGGATWEPVPLATRAILRSIDFGPCLNPEVHTESTGVVVGDAGMVFFTRDRGATWEATKLPLADFPRRVQLLDIVAGAPIYARLLVGTSVLTWEVGTARLTTHHRFPGEVLSYDAFADEEYAIAEGMLFVRPGPQHCLGPI